LASSNPDGYTLMFAANAHTVGSAMQVEKPYDPVKDFTPIALVGASPYVLLTSKNSGIASFKELMDKASAEPGALTYASGGMGSTPHMVMAGLLNAAHLDMLHIPYRGTAEAIQELLAGRIDAVMMPPN